MCLLHTQQTDYTTESDVLFTFVLWQKFNFLMEPTAYLYDILIGNLQRLDFSHQVNELEEPIDTKARNNAMFTSLRYTRMGKPYSNFKIEKERSAEKIRKYFNEQTTLSFAQTYCVGISRKEKLLYSFNQSLWRLNEYRSL